MTNRSDRIKAHLAEAKAKSAYNPAGVFSNEFGPVPPSMRRSSTGIANKWKVTVKDHDGDPQHMIVKGETEGIARASFRSGMHPLAQFKIHKVEPIHEDAAGDVLRASVAKHKLKRIEGTKKSPALIAKLTARVAAGKRYQTEEAIKKAVKPAPKPVKPLTNNPGYGYHGIADRKHKGDANKAHAAYNAMHAKVKNWAGEAGHLAVSKKPNEMVRDYLDSKRGRHLEGLEADEKYIKKDFGHFSRSYDPKLFVESVDLNEGKTKAAHGVFTVWHSGDYKGMVIHHGGNSSNVARVEALAAKLNGQVEAFNNNSKEKSNYHYEVRPLGRKTVSEHAGDPGDDDHSGVYEVQQRDGRYKNVRIKRQPDGKYHIHHADGSKGSTDLKGVKSYISRNNAAWMNEETLTETTRSQDAQRVQYGVMNHDDYLKKWKIGKYGENKNKLAGPGGIYKNLLVDRSIDSKSAATKK